MTSLQQLSLSILNDHNNVNTTTSQVSMERSIVCKHRRSSSMLVYGKGRKHSSSSIDNSSVTTPTTKIPNRFEIAAYNNLKDEWDIVSEYIPATTITRVIGVSSFEAYNAFVLLVKDNTLTCHLLIINLLGQLQIDYKILLNVGEEPLCFDIDQQRREILIGFLNSPIILCYYTSLEQNLIENNKIVITLRRKFKMIDNMGNYPVDIKTVDLLGFCLVLSDSGNIICYDSSRFDIIYILESTLFIFKPVRLWTDRFGSSFVIQLETRPTCVVGIDGTIISSSDSDSGGSFVGVGNSNTSNDDGDQQIEIWSPPDTYTACDSGLFGRVVIPLQGTLLGLTIETIRSDHIDTLLFILTSRLRVYLWKPNHKGKIYLECMLALNISDLLYKSLQQPIDNRHHHHDKFFPNLHQYFGTYQFSSNIPLMPTSSSTCTIGVYNIIFMLGIHVSSIIEAQYQQTYHDIAMIKSQIKQSDNPTQAIVRTHEVENTLLDDFLHFQNLNQNRKYKSSLLIHKNISSTSRDNSYKSALSDVDANSLMSETLQSILNDIANEEDGDDRIRSPSRSSSDDDQSKIISLQSERRNITSTSLIEIGKDSIERLITTPNAAQQTSSSLIMYTDSLSFLPLVGKTIEGAIPTNNSNQVTSSLEQGLNNITYDNNEDVRLQQLQTPSTVYFIPTNILMFNNQSINQAIKNSPNNHHHYQNISLFRICQPYGLMMFSSSQFSKDYSSYQSKVDQSINGKALLSTTTTTTTLATTTATNSELNRYNDNKLATYLLSRKGLLDVDNDISTLNNLDELTFNLCSIAYRTSWLGIFTTFKEGYVFKLNSPPFSSGLTAAATTTAPIRVEFNIKHTTVTTFLLHADIFLQAPSPQQQQQQQQQRHNNSKSRNSTTTTSISKSKMITTTKSSQNSLLVDSKYEFTLFMIGDSEGNINFSIVGYNNVMTTNSFKAHNSSILLILSTGDSMKPLWRLSSEYDENNNVIPTVIPGSAIIIISIDGDVKIFQPIFIPQYNDGVGKKTFDKLFLSYEIEWKLTGLFNVSKIIYTNINDQQNNLKSKEIKISSEEVGKYNQEHKGYHIMNPVSAKLDPTGMYILISFKNGLIELWPIPGLAYTSGDVITNIATVQQCLRCFEVHFNLVHDINVSIYLNDSTICDNNIHKENEKSIDIIDHFAAYVRGNNNLKRTIGYTYKQLLKLSYYSSLVTSSRDYSIILWYFMIEDNGFESSACMFLCPYPCRRFKFSSIPYNGICDNIHLDNNDNMNINLWRVYVIIKGNVIIVIEDERGRLCHYDESIGLETMISKSSLSSSSKEKNMYTDDIKALNKLYGTRKEGLPSIPYILSMPTTSSVLKSSALVRGIALGTNLRKEEKNEHGNSSWNLIEKWACRSFDEMNLLISCLHYDDNNIINNNYSRKKLLADIPITTAHPTTVDFEDDDVIELTLQPSSRGLVFNTTKTTDNNLMLIDDDKIKNNIVKTQKKIVEKGIRMVIDDDDDDDNNNDNNNNNSIYPLLGSSRVVLDRTMTSETKVSFKHFIPPLSSTGIGSGGSGSNKKAIDDDFITDFPTITNNNFGDYINTTAVLKETTPAAAVAAITTMEAKLNNTIVRQQNSPITMNEILSDYMGETMHPQETLVIDLTLQPSSRRSNTRSSSPSRSLQQFLHVHGYSSPLPSGGLGEMIITSPTGDDFSSSNREEIRPKITTLADMAREATPKYVIVKSKDLFDNSSPSKQKNYENSTLQTILLKLDDEENDSDDNDCSIGGHSLKIRNQELFEPEFTQSSVHVGTFKSGSDSLKSGMSIVVQSSGLEFIDQMNLDAVVNSDSISVLSDDLDSEPSSARDGGGRGIMTKHSDEKFKVRNGMSYVVPMNKKGSSVNLKGIAFSSEHNISIRPIATTDTSTTLHLLDSSKFGLISASQRKSDDSDINDSVVNSNISSLASRGNNMKNKGKPIHHTSQIFTFDSKVDNMMKIKQQREKNFMEKLSDRVGADKVQAHQNRVVEASSSVAPNYFDRSAKPIYVERKKTQVIPLQSKRFDKKEDKPYTSRYSTPIGNSNTLNNEDLNSTGSDDSDSTFTSSDFMINSFGDSEFSRSALLDINRILEEVSAEERQQYDAFIEDVKRKLIEVMNQFYHDIAKRGKKKKVMKRLVEYFRTLVSNVEDSMIEAAKLNMDINLNLNNSTDATINLSVSSDHGGRLYLIVVKHPLNESFRHLDTFITLTTLLSIPGLVAYHTLELEPNSRKDITFHDLNCQTEYRIYGIANATDVKMMPINDDVKEAVYIVVNTKYENLDIEWNQLTEHMQLIEMKAAMRCKWIRELAMKNVPEIILPIEFDGKLNKKTKNSKSGTSPSVSRPSSRGKSATKSRPTSRNSKTDSPNSKSRRNSKSSDDDNTVSATPRSNKSGNSGSRSVNRNNDLVDSTKNLLLMEAFKLWWLNEKNPARSFFLLSEIIFVSKDNNIVKSFIESGISTQDEVETLQNYCIMLSSIIEKQSDITDNDIIKSLPTRDQLDISFVKFRSWYKGGQILREFSENNKDNINITATIAPIVEGLNRKVGPNILKILNNQLEIRTKFLQNRINDVDTCACKITELISGYQFAQLCGFTEDDLVLKRNKLTPKEISSIMSAPKLLELSIANHVISQDMTIVDVPTSINGSKNQFNYHNIAGVDIFRIVKIHTLNPNDPPSISAACLPGTNRKPLKAWQLCSIEEKTLEIALACSIDIITMNAVMDGIQIPIADDSTLKSENFPILDLRWKKFLNWYAGDEEFNLIPGKGTPTLQRVLFSEIVEIRCIIYDNYIINPLKERDYDVPINYLNQTFTDEYKLQFRSIIQQDRFDLDSDVILFYQELFNLYEEVVGTFSGCSIRKGLLCKHLNIILSSRRISIMKYLWPPGASRYNNQYFFPRMNLITPRFDLPPHRVKLFPSKHNDSYTFEEIFKWYTIKELENDDYLMIKAEEKGAKMRAYYEWMAKEEERQTETRFLMCQEDFDGHVRKQINLKIEERIKQRDENFKKIIECNRENEPEKEFNFQFNHTLPGEYWYLFENQEYKFGSGIHNGDEIEDMRLEELKRAREAQIAAANFENYLQEEKLRREMEEIKRLQREEQDRRLAEGIVRRRRLREHLEELKIARMLKEEEAEKIKIEKETAEAIVKAEMEKVRLIAAQKQKEIDLQLSEQRLMYYEDIVQYELRSRYKEHKSMEYEDILSYMIEYNIMVEEKRINQRLNELEDLYMPFTPNRHKGLNDHDVEALQKLLQADLTIPSIYVEAMEVLTMPSHHLSLASRSTQSKTNQLSDRYKRIYGDGSINSDTISSSSLKQINTKDNKKNHNIRNEIKLSEDEYKWLRPNIDIPIPVRSASNNYNKEEIRSISRGEINFLNTYDTTWELLKNNSAQCFMKYNPSSSSSRPVSRLEPLKTDIKNDFSYKIDNVSNDLMISPLSYDKQHQQHPFHSSSSPVAIIENNKSSLLNRNFDMMIDNEMINSMTSSSSLEEDKEATIKSSKSSIFDSLSKSSDLSKKKTTATNSESKTKREKMKALLSNSANTIARINQKEWLDYLHIQKKATFASLTSLHSTRAMKFEQLKPIEIEKKDNKNNIKKISKKEAVGDVNIEKKRSAMQVKKELQELGIFDESLLDFRTKQLAQTASDTVQRIQTERAMLKEYVSSDAVLYDQFYMKAIEPGQRYHTSLAIENNISKSIVNNIIDDNAAATSTTTAVDESSNVAVVPILRTQQSIDIHQPNRPQPISIAISNSFQSKNYSTRLLKSSSNNNDSYEIESTSTISRSPSIIISPSATTFNSTNNFKSQSKSFFQQGHHITAATATTGGFHQGNYEYGLLPELQIRKVQSSNRVKTRGVQASYFSGSSDTDDSSSNIKSVEVFIMTPSASIGSNDDSSVESGESLLQQSKTLQSHQSQHETLQQTLQQQKISKIKNKLAHIQDSIISNNSSMQGGEMIM